MAYDVFLVTAIEDREIAKVIARRLRALKFKVWFDAKQTDDTFDDKDAKNAMKSQSMLVVWSEHAVKSDFVRAAASVGHSRSGVLLQARLDKTRPYAPFNADERQSFEGMTARIIPEGFYKIVEELGRRDGRTELRDWMGLGSKDEEKKAAWLRAHPTDPLAIAAEEARTRQLTARPKPAQEAVGAAALAETSLQAGRPTEPRPMSQAPTSMAAAAAMADGPPEPTSTGLSILIPVGVGIVSMLWLAWTVRADPVDPAALPPIANARLVDENCVCVEEEPPLDAGYTGTIVIDE